MTLQIIVNYSKSDIVIRWWTWADSNRLPRRCERRALPIELQARTPGGWCEGSALPAKLWAQMPSPGIEPGSIP